MEKDNDTPAENENSTPLLEEEKIQQEKAASEEGNGKSVILLSTDQDDEAGDKLVSPDDNKIIANPVEVKFNLSDSQNGDAKIDIECVKIAFAGMGKQELMKFANDPFWIRLRWFLFILFWFIWAAMLVGAIAIIVVAPKCSSPAPLVWWEQSPLYQVYVPSFKDGSDPQDGIGDLKGLVSKLNYLDNLGVKGVIISSILKSSPQTTDDTIENFKEIDPAYGSLDDFKALITGIKDKGLHLVMSFVLNHSSNKHPWFVKSENKDPQFSDFYIWAPSSGFNDEKQSPPNNWLSVSGGSAWEWSETRKEFYLHQFRKDQPDLNFRSSAVLEEFKNVLEFWLELGVSGFQFEKIQYILEDVSLKNESIGSKYGPTHDMYDFYSHLQTTNQPDVSLVLDSLKQVVKNHTGSEGFVTVTGSIPPNIMNELNGDSSEAIVDLLQNPHFAQFKPGFTGEDIRLRVQQWLEILPNNTRPSWQLGDFSSSRVASRLSENDIDGLNMIIMLLPGTPITQYGEELGMKDSVTTDANLKGRAPMQWSNTSNAGFGDANTWLPLSSNFESFNVQSEEAASESHLKVYKALVAARNSPSIMYGAMDFNTTANDSVFVCSRIKSGNPGYLVAFNTADVEVVADLTVLKNVSGQLTVAIQSINIENNTKKKLPAEAVPIPPKGALVLTFVPQKSE